MAKPPQLLFNQKLHPVLPHHPTLHHHQPHQHLQHRHKCLQLQHHLSGLHPVHRPVRTLGPGLLLVRGLLKDPLLDAGPWLQMIATVLRAQPSAKAAPMLLMLVPASIDAMQPTNPPNPPPYRSHLPIWLKMTKTQNYQQNGMMPQNQLPGIIVHSHSTWTLPFW